MHTTARVTTRNDITSTEAAAYEQQMELHRAITAGQAVDLTRRKAALAAWGTIPHERRLMIISAMTPTSQRPTCENCGQSLNHRRQCYSCD